MKKKIVIIFCVLVASIFLIAILPARIDCGDSALYSVEERNDAAKLVADKINSIEGCKLFLVKYNGDDASQNNLDYCNELAKDNVEYVDCAVFTSYFWSPFFNAGSLNPNELYSWSWYLARTGNGAWEIITFGYA